LESSANFIEHTLVKQQPSSQSTRYDLARDVVFGWPKPTGRDDDTRTLYRVFDQLFQARVVVADDRFELYVYANAIQFVSEPETVGVCAIGSE